MLQQLKYYLRRWSYPQLFFAKSITDYLAKHNIIPNNLIDAPCGRGETTHYLAKRLPDTQVKGFDLSDTAVALAQEQFKRNNLSFGCMGIHDMVEQSAEINYFCCINSIFLLPEPERLLKLLHDKVDDKGLLFFIIPNIHGRNFKAYQELDPELNSLTFAPEDSPAYFAQFNLKVIAQEGVAYAYFYKRPIIQKLRALAPFYLAASHYLNKWLNRTPQYILLVLQK